MNILFPCMYNNINKVDTDYNFEKQIVDKLDIEYILFNYDEFSIMQKPLKLNKEVNNKHAVKAIYRGWMLSANEYSLIYNTLRNNYNIELINNPKEYINTHYFMNSYNLIEGYTAKSIKLDNINKENTKEIDWNTLKDYFKNLDIKNFIIKDEIKSVKGFDFTDYLSVEMSNEELSNYIEKFINLRGDFYSGSIILKEYLDLFKSNNKTIEFRAFYLNKELIHIYNNSYSYDEITVDEELNSELIELANKIPRLNSNFYTVDFALLKDGTYIIIEIGDGQVSGINNSDNAKEILRKIKFKENQ